MLCLKDIKNRGGGTTKGGIEAGLARRTACSESKLVVVVAKKFSLLFVVRPAVSRRDWRDLITIVTSCGGFCSYFLR